MSFDFADATPIKTVGGGRKAEENPFTGIISQIALKTDKDGQPVAKSFVIEHTEENYKETVGKVKRQLSAAGDTNEPRVTVPSRFTPFKDGKGKEVAGKSNVVFWTVNRQERPRKPKTDGAPSTASTDQSVPVTE